MSLFFLQMTAPSCVKVPEWQEETLAADGENRLCIGARKSCSQGAAPRAAVFQRKKMPHAGRLEADRQCMQGVMVKTIQGNGQYSQWERNRLTWQPSLDKARRKQKSGKRDKDQVTKKRIQRSREEG